MEEILFGKEGSERGVEPGLLEQAHGGVIFFDEVGGAATNVVGNVGFMLLSLWPLRKGLQLLTNSQ